MIIAILGRQPALGMAELEALYGGNRVHWCSAESALVETDVLDVTRLGGTQKAGRVVRELHPSSWREISQYLTKHYTDAWQTSDHKITLGISVYGLSTSPRDIQKTGISLKKKLHEKNVSLRLIPNAETAHNTAVSHHNKLGLSPNKIELLIIAGKNGRTVIAESLGAQNISALAKRDQGRPKRDAFVGMLPPKLARLMINLANRSDEITPAIVLDPFCGTGVVLQEANLLGLNTIGTDLNSKMVAYTQTNLAWLHTKYRLQSTYSVAEADATTGRWPPHVSRVVSETYLGQPFSAPPRPEKLAEVRGNCNHIIGAFLKNISGQLTPGTSICLAIPAWRRLDGSFTHLPLIDKLESYGLESHTFTNLSPRQLLYYRPDQVVARELLVMTKR